MRISGLATGMDTESIIRDLMKANRIPLDKITQKKQYLEWQLDDYRSINRNLQDLTYKINDTMLRQSTFNAKTVSVSNTNAVNIKSLNSTSDFSGTIAVHQLATQATLHGSEFKKNLMTEQVNTTKLSDLGLDIGSGEHEFKIKAPGSDEEKVVKITGNDSLGALIAQINKETDVNAFYDAHTGKIALTAKNSGVGAITVTNVSGELAEKLGLTNGTTSTSGQNAEFTFNGLTTERSSNTFQINGFEINLKQVTDSTSGTTTNAVTFSSAADVDKIVDSVVQFVNDYNKMIEELNAKIREAKYRDFQPLSTEQKNDMKEKEIELWEEKAKSGTLKNDPTISSMLSKMRTIMSSSVEMSDGTKMSLRDLGIKTSTDYLEHGKLIINEDDLRKAIAEDPQKVHELFSKSSDDDGKGGGIAVQFRDTIVASREVISQRAGTAGAVNDSFVLGRNLNDMNKQIERFEDRLKMMEDRYWRQFTAMETAIQRANAQSASLMNAFGGM